MDSPKSWTLARWMLVVGSLLPALYLTALTGLAWFGFGPEPFFVIPVFILGIVAIVWPNRWLMLLPGVILLVNVIGSSQPGGDPGALRPDRYQPFTYWWLSVALAIGLLGAGVANLMHARRGVSPRPTVWGGAAVALVVALWLGGVAAATMEKNVPAQAGDVVAMHPDATLALAAIDADKWSPVTLSIPAGKIVQLNVTNPSSADHVFNQAEAGAKVDLAPGSSHTVWLKLDTPGTYQYYCELHSVKGTDGKWAGMVATLTVT